MNAHPMKVLFLFAIALPFAVLSQEVPQEIILKQKAINREISGLVDLTKNQLTEIATLQNKLQERNSEEVKNRIAKLEKERDETSKKIASLQKELAELDQQLKNIQLDKAATLYGRVQLMLDSLPPSERKFDAQENNTLEYYYNLFKSSPGFSQKVKQYWKANVVDEQPDKFTKARERKKLPPEIQKALLETIKQNVRELKGLKTSNS
jgi:hypothetical protein